MYSPLGMNSIGIHASVGYNSGLWDSRQLDAIVLGF